MLRNAIIQTVVFIVRFLAGISSCCRDLIHMGRGRHRLITRDEPGRLEKKPHYKRAVVIALYPNDDTLPFTLNLMKGFAAADFFILGVSTKPLVGEINAHIGAHCHHIIERFNMGYDFASYQTGLGWIGRQGFLQGIDTLAIANDSLFYPASIADTIKDAVAQNANWTGLFENFQFHYHVGSFFEIFRTPVFASPLFLQFWRKYRPFSSRIHAIQQGEVGLTRMLVKAGFVPRIVYARQRILQAAAARLAEEGLCSDILSLTPRKQALPELMQEIDKRAKTLNPTHALGMLCNVLLGAPIKCDISYRANIPIEDVLKYAQGFTREELAAMRRLLNAKGLSSSVPRLSWRGLKIAAGVM
jgi:hypothetical protein